MLVHNNICGFEKVPILRRGKLIDWYLHFAATKGWMAILMGCSVRIGRETPQTRDSPWVMLLVRLDGIIEILRGVAATSAYAKNGKLFRRRAHTPRRGIHFSAKLARNNSTFYKKFKRNMSRFKASARVVDLARSRRSIDLLTDVQTFLNRRGHGINIRRAYFASRWSSATTWAPPILIFPSRLYWSAESNGWEINGR